MRNSWDQVAVDGDLSVPAISQEFPFDTQDSFYIRIKWTGTPNGTFYLQSAGKTEEFVDTGDTRVVDAGEGTGSHTWADGIRTPDFRIRVRWEPGVGSTGSVNIWVGGKGIG